MRWSGQQVLDDGVGAELALPGLRGLLRTVRVPEFAGVMFHEVEAKSALNRVPGDSPMPFRWTVNPYRGCGHACVYCLDGATRVLLADGRTRPIAELHLGEVVLGTAVDAAGVRRYVPTPVLAHWSTTKPGLPVRSPTAPARGQRRAPLPHRARMAARGTGWCRAGRRPRLRRGDVLLGPGSPCPAAPDPVHRPYRQGYLHGLVRADAAGHVEARGRPDRPAFPSERLELEALGRAHHLLATEAAQRVPTRTAAPRRARRAARRRVTLAPTARGGRRRRPCGGRATGGPPDGPAARAVCRAGWTGPCPPVSGRRGGRPEHRTTTGARGSSRGIGDAGGAATEGELRFEHSRRGARGAARPGALHRLGFAFTVERCRRSNGEAAGPAAASAGGGRDCAVPGASPTPR